ncbi:hypothetical protein EOPP23_08110 [Endozoicomonas sp. OPT23]|nr:hypothetical protein [Endozoicomonas sp. OPT23]
MYAFNANPHSVEVKFETKAFLWLCSYEQPWKKVVYNLRVFFHTDQKTDIRYNRYTVVVIWDWIT